MAYTEGVFNVKDAAGTSTPVDAALVTNTSTTEAATGTTAARQIMAVGDPSTPANVAAVDANQNLAVMNRAFKTTTIDTTTGLANAATYTSSWFDTSVDGTQYIQMDVYSNLGSGTVAVDGSNDTTDSNMTRSLFSVNTGSGLTSVCCPITTRYYRVKYTNNGGSTQTTFKFTHTAFTQMPLGAQTANVTSGGTTSSIPVIAVQPDSSGFTVSANQNGTWGNTLTKGTQGSTGWSVQNLKDAGRTQFYMGATQITGVVSESVITCNITKGQAAQTAASTYTVTAGKTLRIESLRYGVSGAAGVCTIRLRLTSVTGAPIFEDSLVYGATTVNQSSEQMTFADGLELSAGTVINWTMACASTSQKVDVCLIGFEY